MDEEILGCEEEFQMSIQCPPSTPEQRTRNTVITKLQQLIVSEQFQNIQSQFIKVKFDLCYSPEELQGVFVEYRNSIGNYLVNKMQIDVPEFNLEQFYQYVEANRDFVDMGVYDTVAMCAHYQDFQEFYLDFRKATEEQERYRVLTVKTNKIAENKKIKGNQENIFAASNKPNFGMINKQKFKNNSQKQTAQKTQDELFVPETVLTVKGLRKS